MNIFAPADLQRWREWRAAPMDAPPPFLPKPAPKDVRAARAGTTHPREWTCGVDRCGLLFRYARADEAIDSRHCPEDGPHEFIVCPNVPHAAYAICAVHSPDFAEDGG